MVVPKVMSLIAMVQLNMNIVLDGSRSRNVVVTQVMSLGTTTGFEQECFVMALMRRANPILLTKLIITVMNICLNSTIGSVETSLDKGASPRDYARPRAPLGLCRAIFECQMLRLQS